MDTGSISEIKQKAKENLSKSGWGKSIVITIIFYIVTSLIVNFSTVSFNNFESTNYYNGILSSCLQIFIFGVLIYGIKKYFFNISEGLSPDISEIFYYFTSWRRYGKALHASILVGIILCGLWIVLSIVLVTVSLSIITLFLNNMGFNFWLIPVYTVSTIVISLTISTILIICFSLNYFLVPFLIADNNENRSVRECIKESKRLMKGNKWFLIKLYLSFLPWLIACLLVIPIVYVQPYMWATFATVARQIIGKEQNTTQNEYISNDLDI